MATKELTKENFQETIDNNDIVIVDLWAEWCGPCKAFAPVFEKVSDEHQDIVFAKIDTEAQRELAAAFGIQAIPTLMVFREQVLLYKEAGALRPPQLRSLVEQVKGVDMEEVHAKVASAQAEAEA